MVTKGELTANDVLSNIVEELNGAYDLIKSAKESIDSDTDADTITTCDELLDDVKQTLMDEMPAMEEAIMSETLVSALKHLKNGGAVRLYLVDDVVMEYGATEAAEKTLIDILTGNELEPVTGMPMRKCIKTVEELAGVPVKIKSAPARPYFFTINQHSLRDMRIIGIKTGVLFATDEETAREEIWKKHGNDGACQLMVDEIIPNEGYSYTVYKSALISKDD